LITTIMFIFKDSLKRNFQPEGVYELGDKKPFRTLREVGGLSYLVSH